LSQKWFPTNTKKRLEVAIGVLLELEPQPTDQTMRLPKHKLPKQKAAQKVQRSNKHKSSRNKVGGGDAMSVAAEDITDTFKETKESKEEQEVSEEVDMEDDEEVDATSVNTEAATASPGRSTLATNLKSKDERSAIRDLRRQKNKKNNLYKIRNGNCSGKNGPRAINRSKNT